MSPPELIVGRLPANQPATNRRSTTRQGEHKARGPALSERAYQVKTALPGNAGYAIGRWLMSAYTGLMLDVDTQWHAPIPEGPKILAANHPTTTDPLYLITLLSEPVSYLITAALFDVPAVGRYLRAAGHLPALRGSGGATVDALVREVQAGRSVAIFPEGALSPLAGGFHKPHSGVGRVALRTGVPVIPIGIGLERQRIRTKEVEMDGDKAIGRFYPSGPYAITVGQPIAFTGDAADHERVRAVADQIMHHVRELARESDRRIEYARGSTAAIRSGPAWSTGVAGVLASRKRLS